MVQLSDLKQEERFRALLTSLNSEFKNVTLFSCLDTVEYRSATDLRRAYSELLENSGLNPPNALILGSYCSRIFNPLGITEGEKTWKLTPDGSNYNRPAAALAIKTANYANVSFHEVLGRANNPQDTVGPYRRAKILMRLADVKEASQIDLKRSLGVEGTSVHFHLVGLADAGLIDYESIGRGEPGWAPYKWIEDRDPNKVKFRKRTSLALKAAKKMSENPKEWTCYNLSKELPCTSAHAAIILGRLAKQNLAKRVGKFMSASKHSEARITEKGRRVVDPFLNPTYEAVNPNNGSLEDYKETLYAYSDDPNLAQNHVVGATQLYLDASPFLKNQIITPTQ